MYWHRAWEHEYNYLLDTRPRAWWMLYYATTSKNLLNNLKSNLPNSKFLDQAILGPTPGPFSTGALGCCKIQPHYNRLASTPASPILQNPKFRRWMAPFVLRTAANACQKKVSSNQSENIHPLKFKEVRQGSGRSKPPAVNSSQIGSQASAPSLPHSSLWAKLMSTTDLLDFKAVAKAWPPWNAFRVQSWIILMPGIRRKL